MSGGFNPMMMGGMGGPGMGGPPMGGQGMGGYGPPGLFWKNDNLMLFL